MRKEAQRRPSNSRLVFRPATDLPPQAPLAERQAARAKVFSRGLYKLMLAKNWHQRDFARAAGISDDAISRYIRGRSLPTMGYAEKMAAALGMTVPEMMAACDTKGSLDDGLLQGAPAGPAKWMRLQIDQMVPYALAIKVLGLLEKAPDHDTAEADGAAAA